MRELDEEIYRNEDRRARWEDQLRRFQGSNRERAQQEIKQIDDELAALRERRSQMQAEWDATPTTQAARHAGGQFGSFIRKLQREGRLPQD